MSLWEGRRGRVGGGRSPFFYGGAQRAPIFARQPTAVERSSPGAAEAGKAKHKAWAQRGRQSERYLLCLSWSVADALSAHGLSKPQL